MGRAAPALSVGKVALVTGASRGIGRSIALRLARDGMDVVVHYQGNLVLAEETCRLVEQEGQTAYLVQADFSQSDGVLACAQATVQVLAGRRLDVLVNNAGQVIYEDFERSTPEGLERLWRVNLEAPFFLSQRLLPHLSPGARIVNISSTAAQTAFAEVMEYSLTKAALESFTRTLAQYLGPRGINVNAVAPGEILTDMSSWLEEPEAQAMVLDRQALKRLGAADEVADVVAFLAGPDSRWMTGEVLTVSGGYRYTGGL